MGKLMIAAAAAAMVVVGNAALKPSVCVNCGANSDSECETVVFKVTGSGKAVLDKGDYKTVGAIKIKKGALALEGQICETTGACCYDGGWLFATVKAGKKTAKLAAEVELGVWSIFGKKLEASRSFDEEIKPGKKVTLDSALFLASSATEEAGGDVDLSEFALAAAAFGKVDFKVTKEGKGYCKNDKGCDPIYTPKTYTGWFVGTYPCVNEEDCFLCECTDTDVFGGTWKAVFQAKRKTLASAMSLAGIEVADDED